MLKELIGKYIWVLLILLLIVLLLLSRLFIGDHFKPGAEKNAFPALSESNTMGLSQIELSKSKVILVYLDNESELELNADIDVFVFEAEELILKQNIKELRKFKLPIVLISEDPSVSARAWMLLAQKGVKKLFIYSGPGSVDSFKYEFRPDTLNASERPESQ